MEDCIDDGQCRVVFCCDDDSLLPPTRSKTTKVGYDLTSTTSELLQPGESCDFHTGFTYMGVHAPNPVRDETDIHISDCIAVVESRTVLFTKHRVYVPNSKRVHPGDSLVVTLTNEGNRAVRIDVGDKIAQLVIARDPEAYSYIAIDIKKGASVKDDCVPTDSIKLGENEWGRVEPYAYATHTVFGQIVTGEFRGRIYMLTPMDDMRPVAQLAIRKSFLPDIVRVVRSDRSTRKDYSAVKNRHI